MAERCSLSVLYHALTTISDELDVTKITAAVWIEYCKMKKESLGPDFEAFLNFVHVLDQLVDRLRKGRGQGDRQYSKDSTVTGSPSLSGTDRKSNIDISGEEEEEEEEEDDDDDDEEGEEEEEDEEEEDEEEFHSQATEEELLLERAKWKRRAELSEQASMAAEQEVVVLRLELEAACDDQQATHQMAQAALQAMQLEMDTSMHVMQEELEAARDREEILASELTAAQEEIGQLEEFSVFVMSNYHHVIEHKLIPPQTEGDKAALQAVLDPLDARFETRWRDAQKASKKMLELAKRAARTGSPRRKPNWLDMAPEPFARQHDVVAVSEPVAAQEAGPGAIELSPASQPLVPPQMPEGSTEYYRDSQGRVRIPKPQGRGPPTRRCMPRTNGNSSRVYHHRSQRRGYPDRRHHARHRHLDP